MIDYIIAELKYKAKIFNDIGAVSVLDGDVVKSDSAVPESLKEELKAMVKKLEDIPDIYKDWHPGSEGKVLDLVHPSLFPLVYGRSRILQNEIVQLENCAESSGKGSILPVPDSDDARFDESIHAMPGHYTYNVNRSPVFSRKFQWLPCDVDFLDNGRSVK